MRRYHDDMAFLDALRQRKAEAFDELYAAYYRPLCFFAENLVGNADAAQDLATESFIKLLDFSGSFDSTKGLKSFLYTVTRNACYDHLRAIRRHKGSHAEITRLSDEQYDNAERQLIRAEVLQAIYAAIEKLPRKYKGPIKLALLEGKKNEEIAEDLSIAPQTVRNRKSEGIKLLRVALSQQQNLSPLIISYFLFQAS
ncbi:MAG TPA: sigma-70 family RNA polymerase sigma factor [Flavitalea sp.]|nr:sigma-70 family RNA polymerase sigma factor [Flavitalea sp.]